MCEPVSAALSLLSFGVSAASAQTGYIGAKNDALARTVAYNINRGQAIQAHENAQRGLTEQQSQVMESAAQSRFDNAMAARAAKATSVVAAGEAGVGGLSVEQLLRDIAGRSARVNDRIDQQTDWTMAEIQRQKEQSGYEAKDRMLSMQPGVKPSYAPYGLKILGSALDSVAAYKTYSSKSKK